MTIDEAIKRCKEEAEKYMEYGIETECYQCGKEHEQLAEWLTELQELKLQIAAPRLGSIEEYHYELAKCKAAFWSCNRRCMDAEEQYRRKADELRKAQEQIAEYKRLLKAAVEDMNNGGCNSNCYKCKYCGVCDYSERFTWKLTDEALKLIEESK